MPLVHFPHELFSPAELSAARLDGELTLVGEAYASTAGLETSEIRAASMRLILGERLAAIGMSAAWVHGAVGLPPAVHHVQRGRAGVARPVRHDVRFRDTPLAEDDTVVIGGVRVASPARTLVELAREASDPEIATVAARLATPGLIDDALRWLRAHRRFPGRQPAMAYLASLRSAARDPGQDDVTR